jgi:acyl carrier protein
VLGRGVEHQLLAELGRRAEREGKKLVELPYRPSEKNRPAFEFLKSLDVEMAKDETGNGSIKVPAKKLASLQYEPDKKEQAARKISPGATAERTTAFGASHRSEIFQRICDELSGITQVAKAIENFRADGKADDSLLEIEPGDSPESALSKIWKRVLGRKQIGLNENFFEAGGNSLRAVHVIALIQKKLKISLSITALFECPTIRLLAAKLTRNPARDDDSGNARQAHMRGQQRRQIKHRRKPVLK